MSENEMISRVLDSAQTRRKDGDHHEANFFDEIANELARLQGVVDKFNILQLEAREIYQQSHDDEEIDTGDAVNFIGRVAGVEEGWEPSDEEPCGHSDCVQAFIDTGVRKCHHEEEDDTCSVCDGSGIGQQGDPETSSYPACHGSGSVKNEEPSEIDDDI
jgi:hypothetical protein